jgi:predicted DNA binding CopG/RHH family protein
MNSHNLPKTDSIQELATFWDTHDLTEFGEELEEVKEPVFERETRISVQLDSNEAQALHKAARSRGLPDSELVRQWVLERIHAS